MDFPLENDRVPVDAVVPRAFRVAMSTLVAALSLLAFLGITTETRASKTITIYKNELNTADRQAQITKFAASDSSCSRQPRPAAVRVKVGRETRECFMRIPVVGKNVEVSAIGRLFDSTPKSIRGRTYVALSLRQSSNGARYQLAVFPAARKFQLRKISGNGTIRYLASGKAGNAIKGIGKANRMTLRAFNGVGSNPASTTRLVASVNGKRLAFADDAEGGSLTGTAATFSIGSQKVAKGALGSFASLVAKIPDPFA